MVKQGDGGSIAIVSSVHAFRPYALSTAYNGAKAAINHMAATWAAELAQHRIRVNVLEPGWIDTPGERAYTSERQIKERGSKLLMGRLGTSEEMAKAVPVHGFGNGFLLHDRKLASGWTEASCCPNPD